jgi:hypothetical protein
LRKWLCLYLLDVAPGDDPGWTSTFDVTCKAAGRAESSCPLACTSSLLLSVAHDTANELLYGLVNRGLVGVVGEEATVPRYLGK